MSILLLALLVVFALWLKPWQEEGALSGSEALLYGRVTDQASKAPLRGAVIRVEHEGGRLEVKSDPQGNYQAVIDASEPIGITVDVRRHIGAAAFGKLCPGERREFSPELTPSGIGQAPPAPVILPKGKGC